MEISVEAIILIGIVFVAYSAILFSVISARGVTISKLEVEVASEAVYIKSIQDILFDLNGRIVDYHASVFYDKVNGTIVTFDNLENIGEF